MATEEKLQNKACCFYASDFHLEMTLVPYINRKLEENKNIIIVTQNELKESLEVLISKMHIKNKEEILNINWNNNNIDKIDNLENSVVIINGNQEFIKKINNQIKEKPEPIELIDCYLFDEIKDKIDVIRDSYPGVLNNLQKNY